MLLATAPHTTRRWSITIPQRSFSFSSTNAWSQRHGSLSLFSVRATAPKKTVNATANDTGDKANSDRTADPADDCGNASPWHTETITDDCPNFAILLIDSGHTCA